MSWKNKPVCGLSVKPYYLDKNLMSVARMTVCKTAGGDLVWSTLPGIERFSDRGTLHLFIWTEAKAYGVLIYVDCYKGQAVTKKEEIELRARGLLDHLK